MNAQSRPKTYMVTLSRLVRQTLTLKVQSLYEGKVNASEIFSQVVDNDGWEDDNEWGCEEGTHNVSEYLHGPADIDDDYIVGSWDFCKFCAEHVSKPIHFHQDMVVCEECYDPRLQCTS